MDIQSPYQETPYRDTAIRLIKAEQKMFGPIEITADADFYCVVQTGDSYFYETESEYVFYINHLVLKDACLVSITAALKPDCQIKRVICENASIVYSQNEETVVFVIDISGLTGKTRTLYAHTLIREPGLTLRIEQNDPTRRAGKYKEGKFPDTQVHASIHYQFAVRELVRMMGIPKYLNDNKLGYLLILGFETCNEAHSDYPPHWHIIYRWPTFCGSQAPHIYLDEGGKMLYNRMSIDGISGVSRTYEYGQWCQFVDHLGRSVMAFALQSDGSMVLTKPRDGMYKMSRWYPGEGVNLFKDGVLVGNIKTDNDMEKEMLTVQFSSQVAGRESFTEIIQYDLLDGKVISRTVG